MNLSIFTYTDYVEYLQAALSTGQKARGRRSALARYLSCQSSFVSLVLSKKANLSLEHAIKASGFLQLSLDEQRFFICLVQRSRAGSKELEMFYDKQIDELRRSQKRVRERIAVSDELKSSDQATYYSMWWYAAIHILAAFSDIKTRDDLVKRLGLSPQTVNDALNFLTSRNLVKVEKGQLSIGAQWLHLAENSTFIARHHANWRLKAIEAVERAKQDDLHFSGIIGISRQDAERLREMLLEFLQKSKTIINTSRE